MSDKNLKQLGQNIKRIREGKDISQADLARMCEFERSNMARIETGNTNPTVLTLLKIANSLEVSIEELVKGI